jgi:FkbM family methyltransferase
MAWIKKILARFLSQGAYLRTLHRSFFLLYRIGFLKNKPAFSYHYFVKKLIKADDVVVDLGANLGYFARTFSDLTPNGRVVAIEPIPLFYNVLQFFLGNRKNIELHNVALGKEAGSVYMVLPETDGFIRTGLPHVVSKETELQQHKHQQVVIASARSFFEQIGTFSYLKCDIEGYEGVVMPEIMDVLNRVRPLIQIEIAQKNKELLLQAFEGIGYERYSVVNNRLVLEVGQAHVEGDYLFIPKEKTSAYMPLM